MRQDNVPEWNGKRRGNSGGNEDERGNDLEAHVHRVTNLRCSMGSRERGEEGLLGGWTFNGECSGCTCVSEGWAMKVFTNQCRNKNTKVIRS
jgi:hypothetical protein